MCSVKSGNKLALELAPMIDGKVILTTGVTLLGGGFVLAVARSKPSMLILAGRNTAKVEETTKAITDQFPLVKVRTLELNLLSLSSVRKAADTVNGRADIPHIDVLVNNAGVMAVDWAVSPEGYESQLVINRLGHFLFPNTMIPKILKCPQLRIVVVSNNGHRLSPFRFDDWNFRVRLVFFIALLDLLPYYIRVQSWIHTQLKLAKHTYKMAGVITSVWVMVSRRQLTC